MQFYLKPEGGTRVLFSVLDSLGKTAYEVTGEYTSFGSRYVLRGPGGAAAARLNGVNLPGSFRYSAAAGSRRIRIKIKPDSVHRPVQFKGARWRFRGSVTTRSFDVVEDLPHGRPFVVMTHSRCWNGHGDCYAVTVAREADVALALCVAVAVDCAILGGCISPVPAG